MDAATVHFLLLVAAAVVVWSLAGRLARRIGGRAAEDRQKENEALSNDVLERRLKGLYARRAQYRIGVFAGCVLALAVYFSGGHRLLSVICILGACWCQYCVYRHSTTQCLTELMRRRAGGTCLGQTPEKRQ